MGAWGPGIFSDDTAADIRGDYRELLEDQVPDADASARVIEAYRDLDGDEEHVLWLALAAAQSQVGRLDADVKARALDVIDTGRGLELWEEAGPKELAKRRAALAKLREQLTGPQPARRALRPPWRHVTDLAAGTVLRFHATNGDIALLRVARVDDHRLGAAPIVEWLEWAGPTVPSDAAIRSLRPRERALAGGELTRPARYRVSKDRKKDPDWADSGFEIVTVLPPRPDDEQAEAWIYCGWSVIAAELERALTAE